MTADNQGTTSSVYWEIHDGASRPRFYEARLEPDGPGRWRLIRRWGYLGCRGWRLIHHHEDRAAAERELAAVARRRARQSYQVAHRHLGPPAEGDQLLMPF
jgi:predicted DNA-binding WGR domain protein